MDGTGLYYYRARYYSPTHQRFVSSDPIGLSVGLNIYSYVYNIPLRWTDPNGLDAQEVIDDIINVGLAETIVGNAIASQAISDARKSGLPGARNGVQDAYRHCLWSCLMAKAMGYENAQIIGDNHESASKRNGQPSDEESMNRSNNQQGRMCGVKNNADCPQQCLDKLMGGGLSGPGGNPTNFGLAR